MNELSPALARTFEKIAAGRLKPNNFGTLLKAAVRAGWCSEETLAVTLDVQPKQVFKVVRNMDDRKIREIAQTLIRN